MRHSRILSSALRRTPMIAAYRASIEDSRQSPSASSRAIRRLSVVRPDLVGEWVPDMNDLDVSTVSINATELVTWRCTTCSHQWTASVRDRAIGEGGCPECARRATSGIASLNNKESIASTHSEAAKYWDTALNGSLRPTDVSATSTRGVWWKSSDGKESFRRPVYAFLREHRSLREIHSTQAEERVTALEHLAPLVGYGLPDSIRRVVEGFKAAPPNAQPYISRTSPGSLTLSDVTAFEDQWCAEFNEAKLHASASHKRNASLDKEGLVSSSSATGAQEPIKKKATATLTLALDTSLTTRGGYIPSVPINAMLDYHAEQLISAIAQGKPGTSLPSYLIDREDAKGVYALDEMTRSKINSRRVAANRLRFKVKRSLSQPLKSREMPSMPSPDAILESEATGRSKIEEVASPTLTESDYIPQRRVRRAGFRRNQSLDMPEEVDESPITLSSNIGGNEGGAEEKKAATPVPAPEVVAPAAPRVVGRRKKS